MSTAQDAHAWMRRMEEDRREWKARIDERLRVMERTHNWIRRRLVLVCAMWFVAGATVGALVMRAVT